MALHKMNFSFDDDRQTAILRRNSILIIFIFGFCNMPTFQKLRIAGVPEFYYEFIE
ncbi:hypothetical protein LEP1GSC171_0397 [Leptospira santarosai str. HAI1380]|uniref:Uncharacterized protein n=2 Tax=Leptospira santarosai TaxID=28183 RepID=M6UIF7_9LEPT|nr:hypothetical protein [Leptospira santarosai]EMJ48767.1 hypothetical protein LEP1GSC169_1010 [Leptospira santarosai str. HAI1349]EMO33418.1 hypothetical protein LEP1GSC175_3649 [Leptospira santarosai str. HAI821]EMO44917.1 hypothetical protein LEP1GSC187_2400 [Leptospira santarosai str. ZUN179]EMP01894.1 hypothetical protein LEP1GSC171_0397 [Leptospira santarosai str. HAI1380]EMP81147.1 hypothetical protein LEP1GSC162_1674 [Leptospira santarosai str. CBC1531]